MNLNPVATPQMRIEQALQALDSCLSLQRDALIRGDLEDLRESQLRLQEAVQRADLQALVDRIGPTERDSLRQSLRQMLAQCSVNAGLAGRAAAGIARAREALGQRDEGLYGVTGQALRGSRQARRINA